MEERLSFVARLLEGEGCQEFGISRKTGYKIFNCYGQDGSEALTDRAGLANRRAYGFRWNDPSCLTMLLTQSDDRVS